MDQRGRMCRFLPDTVTYGRTGRGLIARDNKVLRHVGCVLSDRIEGL
jgi:hypothetical protein